MSSSEPPTEQAATLSINEEEEVLLGYVETPLPSLAIPQCLGCD